MKRFLLVSFFGIALPHQASLAQSSAAEGCALPADSGRLRVSLPIDVLDHLEGMATSVFVHAYLISIVADTGAGDHRLARCAREFVATKASNVKALRGNVPDAMAIIDALRSAELTRRAVEQLRDSVKTIGVLVGRLGTDTSAASIEAVRHALIAFDCGIATTICNARDLVVKRVDSLWRTRGALDRLEEMLRQNADAQRRLSAEEQGAIAALTADSAQLQQITDTAAARTRDERIRKWLALIGSLRNAREQLAGPAETTRAQRDVAAQAIDSARAGVGRARGTLLAALKAADLVGNKVRVFDRSAIPKAPQVSVPVAQGPTTNPAAQRADILLALTDFIIDRARREMVNSFIVTLYDLMAKDSIVKAGFPETWGLMNGVGRRGDGRLNAVEVGRVPLAAWRSTLAGDFVALPVNLIEREPPVICGASASEDATSQTPFASTRQACIRRIALLKPIAPVARRLIAGDAVFDILRDAATLVPATGPDLPAEWLQLSEGLTMLAALADTYVQQGDALKADALHHPYILTSASLTQVPQRQRDAFVRVLLVRAVPTSAEIPATLDVAALQTAVVGGMRTLELLAARPTSSELKGVSAAQLVHETFDAMGCAIGMARSLTNGDVATSLDTVQRRWNSVSRTIEPITAGDFGLALARTMTLLRDLRGGDLPGPVLTFSALASSLSEARGGEDVRQAFETAASPVGGWQSKRYGDVRASITAFPGIALGGESVIASPGDPDGTAGVTPSVGISLPVGVEMQWKTDSLPGTGTNACRWVCGSGVFVPLIDLGALLNYRLHGNDVVSTEPNSSIRQVFAPGLYLSLAMTRTVPLNVLTGVQFMPSLRSVDGTGGTSTRSAVRFGVSFGLDVMLYGFSR